MKFRNWPLQTAAKVIRAGGVIAYPTEAVWGLGCDPYNPDAVRKLLEIKNRPVDKGLILITGNSSDFQPWLYTLSQKHMKELELSWPGFNTWVVPDSGVTPSWIMGVHNGVALRVSAHPLVKALCEAFGGPIVSTSANVAGHAAARNRCQVEQYFHGQLDYVLAGALGGERQASVIRDLVTGQPLRGA